jgi:hypothetical protein
MKFRIKSRKIITICLYIYLALQVFGCWSRNSCNTVIGQLQSRLYGSLPGCKKEELTKFIPLLIPQQSKTRAAECTQPPQAVTCLPSTSGTTYNVGPGQALTSIGAVDWNNLKAGDTVRIFYRSTPYAEKILLSTSGTVENPIRVCGVLGGASGDLQPTITGENATTRTDLRFENENKLVNGFSDALERNLIVITNGDFEKKPANIIIEGLHLTGANEFNTFTDVRGATHNYIGFSACVMVHKADNVVIRGNELENCGHGIFALSKDYEPSTSRNLLIESNYLHGNGATTASEVERVHGMYIQTVGVTLQFNYFGPHRVGAKGAQYKDRSTGSIVRYNFFTPAARVLDFVEQTDYDTSIDTRAWDDFMKLYPTENKMPTRESVVAAEAANLKTYVYGNFIRNTFIEGNGAYAPIHWGGDQDVTNAYGEYLGRHGKLFFFNNTIVVTADYRTDGKGTARLSIFDQGKGSSFTNKSSIEAYNNVIHIETVPNQFNQTVDAYLMRHNMGVVNLGTNWITDKWKEKGTDIIEPQNLGLIDSGILNGTSNLIKGTTSPVNSVTLLATSDVEKTTLKGKGQALPVELSKLLCYECRVNHANPIQSIKAIRDPATTIDIGAAAIP